jgi:hypothetical protein
MTVAPTMIVKDRPNARVSATPEPPPNRQRKRRQLGLRPAPGASDDVAHEANPASEAGVGEYEDPTVALIVQSNALLVDLVEDQRRHFESKLPGLGNTIDALKNENQALKLILENLRITQRGERGIDGDRGPPGRDGRDGAPGALGPRGDKGAKGDPAPRLATWSVDAERFTVTPVFGDASSGAALNLLELFQSYDRAVSEIEDRDLVEAAHAARIESERQAEASRWER